MQPVEFQGLHNLVAPHGARKNRKRLGRGESSGHGKTSGRGHKGQKARKSGNVRIGFEGGQNPMARRVPKRGFSNSPFVKTFSVVNFSRIASCFQPGAVIDMPALVVAGLVTNVKNRIKLLSDGQLEGAYTFKVHAASKAAIEKVKEKGGSVELIGRS